MALIIGAVLALLIGLFASGVGLDRDKAFYPTVMIVIALNYALFSVIGGSVHALLVESVVIIAFVCASVAGFRYSLWLIVASLAMHGIYDFFHGHFFTNPGVPAWWPEFCLAYDVMAAIYLAVRLLPGYPFRAMKTER